MDDADDGEEAEAEEEERVALSASPATAVAGSCRQVNDAMRVYDVHTALFPDGQQRCASRLCAP